MSDSDEYPRSTIMIILNGVGMFLILVSFMLPVAFWSSLPDRVPQHFNILGEPDGWGGKGNIFIAPVIGLIVYGIISLVSGSMIANYPFAITEENAERQYAIARAFGTAFKVWAAATLTWIEWMMIQIARGNAHGFGVFAAIIPGVMVTIIATYLVKAFLAR